MGSGGVPASHRRRHPHVERRSPARAGRHLGPRLGGRQRPRLGDRQRVGPSRPPSSPIPGCASTATRRTSVWPPAATRASGGRGAVRAACSTAMPGSTRTRSARWPRRSTTTRRSVWSVPCSTTRHPRPAVAQRPSCCARWARVGRTPGPEVLDRVPTGDRRVVDFLSGACQVFRRQTYYLVGGFDEWYFLGPEDVDFCLRVREAGLRVQQVTAPAMRAHAAADASVRGSRRQRCRRCGGPTRSSWGPGAGYGDLSTRPAALRRASRSTIRR